MTVSLEFFPGVMRAARAMYRRKEFALDYSVEQAPPAARNLDVKARVEATLGIRAPKWLGVADTLVTVFSGADADFVAFDSYTNIDLWTRTTELPWPNVIGVGKVCLAKPPRDTDQIDLGVVPRFHYSESQASLLITLGRVGTKHYQVSTCLVIGIDDEGLASLQVSNLTVD